MLDRRIRRKQAAGVSNVGAGGALREICNRNFNVVTLITKDGIKELPLMGKDEVAGCLLDEIAARR